ncbi:MAG: lipase [Desulfobacterales bacterium]|nr:lipase [Desulfobacterales bacterium]
MEKKKIFIAIIALLNLTFYSCANLSVLWWKTNKSTYSSNEKEEKNNDYPIILITGYGGWGQNELLGYNYFGGPSDIEKILRKRGISTFVIVPGGYSSIWDRACEIYAQIKGGRVDYGKFHSEKYGHERFGRTYEGVYKDWGEKNKITGKIKKVHLVGHSFGGIAARMIVQLLEHGNLEESQNTPPNELSPLFQGECNNYVHSVTTIASPNNGTTLLCSAWPLNPNIQDDLTILLAGITGLNLQGIYDVRLDQWGIKREKEESFKNYMNRIKFSKYINASRDSGIWDASPEGTLELNTWVKAQPNVYYFSFATEQTHKGWFSNNEYPDWGMFLPFQPFSALMGSYTQKSPNRVIIDEKWFKNDGIVNTYSMDGPKIGSEDVIVEFNGSPKIGLWNYMGVLKNTDHADALGIYSMSLKGARPLYNRIASLLISLPE